MKKSFKKSKCCLILLFFILLLFSGYAQQLPEGENLALLKPAKASSENIINGMAAYGNDGSVATGWLAAESTLPQWWLVDLGQTCDLTGTRVTWQSAYRKYHYTIEVSVDQSDWVMAVNKSQSNPDSAQVQVDLFAAESVRYVRITVTEFSMNRIAGFKEFEVFGTSAGSVPTPTPTPVPTATATPRPTLTLQPTATPTLPPTATPTLPPTPTPQPTATPLPDVIPGDANNNGVIDILDALLIANYYVGKNPEPFFTEAADVDGNGKVDIIDALLVAQYYVGLIKFFPAARTIIAADVCTLGLDAGNRLVSRLANNGEQGNGYASVCAWYGSLVFADLTGNSSIINRSISLYSPYLNGTMQPRTPGHVDNNVFGIWPFQLYQVTGNSGYLALANQLAEDEYNPPRSDGLCRYTRFWVDDLYMICSLQTQAYKANNDNKYMDRCGLQITAYAAELQQSNGLFHHTLNSPYFWGRGNGWAAAGMTEVLQVMPTSHSYYGEVMSVYRKMMATLLSCQDSSGMWHQVLDNSGSYLESSCTGMFLFALATGIRRGWLPAGEYLPVVEKGWRGYQNYINSNGQVREICVGTGEGSSLSFYLTRPRSVGDLHGQAAATWAAMAVVQLCNESGVAY